MRISGGRLAAKFLERGESGTGTRYVVRLPQNLRNGRGIQLQLVPSSTGTLTTSNWNAQGTPPHTHGHTAAHRRILRSPFLLRNCDDIKAAALRERDNGFAVRGLGILAAQATTATPSQVPSSRLVPVSRIGTKFPERERGARSRPSAAKGGCSDCQDLWRGRRTRACGH